MIANRLNSDRVRLIPSKDGVSAMLARASGKDPEAVADCWVVEIDALRGPGCEIPASGIAGGAQVKASLFGL